MQLGVPNWIVDDSNSDSKKFGRYYNTNLIPMKILSQQSQISIKIDQFSIKLDQFRLNSTYFLLKSWLKDRLSQLKDRKSQLKDQKSQNSTIFD